MIKGTTLFENTCHAIKLKNVIVRHFNVMHSHLQVKDKINNKTNYILKAT